MNTNIFKLGLICISLTVTIFSINSTYAEDEVCSRNFDKCWAINYNCEQFTGETLTEIQKKVTCESKQINARYNCVGEVRRKADACENPQNLTTMSLEELIEHYLAKANGEIIRRTTDKETNDSTDKTMFLDTIEKLKERELKDSATYWGIKFENWLSILTLGIVKSAYDPLNDSFIRDNVPEVFDVFRDAGSKVAEFNASVDNIATGGTEMSTIEGIYSLVTSINYDAKFNSSEIDTNGKKTNRTIEGVLEKNLGVCRDFSILLHTGFARHNIKSELILSPVHAWVRVETSNGVKFDLDPVNFKTFIPLPPRKASTGLGLPNTASLRAKYGN